MKFDWDDAKREANIKKHGVDFVVAARLLHGNPYVGKSKNPGSDSQRFIAIDKLDGRVYTVVYTMRGEVYRIISARRASDEEKQTWALHDEGCAQDEG